MHILPVLLQPVKYHYSINVVEYVIYKYLLSVIEQGGDINGLELWINQTEWDSAQFATILTPAYHSIGFRNHGESPYRAFSCLKLPMSTYCGLTHSVLNLKVLVGAFNHEKAQ